LRKWECAFAAQREKTTLADEFERPWYNFWPEEVPKNIVYPKISIADLLTRSADRHSSRAALIYFENEITYKELDLLSDKFATALVDLGVRKGDRVALFLPNIPSFIIAFYGTVRSGAMVTAINSMSKEREVEHQLCDSGAETIVVLDLFYPIVSNILEKTRLKRVIITSLRDYMSTTKAVLGTILRKIPSHRTERKPNVFRFTDLINKHEASPPALNIDPYEDVAVLQYTGGTTGTPKAAMLTHMNLVSNTLMCVEWLGVDHHAACLSILPLFHIYGLMSGLNAPICMGAKTVLLPQFHPKQVLQTIQRHKITLFCGVPTLYAKLLSYPDLEKYDCSSLQFCISGADSLPAEVQKDFMKRVGGVLVEGYGLSEASPVTHCNPVHLSPEKWKKGSIGIPWPDTDAKIVDKETGETVLECGQIGELVVKGPQVMKGYWNMPDETASILRDGWLYTGDLGKMDEDGYFYIINRKKDLIKYRGFSVYPQELETVLYEHPGIKLCSVVGIPHPIDGEIPKAFVVLKEGAIAAEKELMNFVNDRVASYKAIQEVEFRTDLPTTITGKILKRELRKTAQDIGT